MTFDVRRRWLVVAMLAVVAAMSLSVAAQQGSQSLQAQFERARLLEENSKTLNEAIALYRQVAARAGSNRALAAQALLRAAEGYQKLGDAEARTIYARIVKEFPDRKEEVARANARLGGAAAVASLKGDRAVWTGSTVDVFGRVSPDARFISYVDWKDGRLMLRDLVTSVSRPLTAAAPNYSQHAEWPTISKDGREIVYNWRGEKGFEVRIAELKETGLLEPRRLADGYVSPLEWSPDGKWIAGAMRLDRSSVEIGVIAVADGSFRPLGRVDASVLPTLRDRPGLFFSPDGRYIAYDASSGGPDSQRDIFVLAADGSRHNPVVVHTANDRLMGWAPDNTRLLFSSDRLGSVGLWAQPVADGQARGLPELLRPNIGQVTSLGLSTSGALYVHRRISARAIEIAPIDLTAGRLDGPPVGTSQGSLDGARSPAWSPDGQYLAYPVNCNGGCVAIQSVATGHVRRVAAALTASSGVSWSPDGRSLLMKSTDAKGRSGLFQIDVQSGEAVPVLMSDGLSVFNAWSSDGKKVYFNREAVFVERDLTSGDEREVSRETGERLGGLSPDGQYLLLARADARGNTVSLLLVPVAGGPLREVLRLKAPDAVVHPNANSWTPDSTAFIMQKYTGSRWELWLVPIDGRPARKLDIDPGAWRPETPTGGSLVLADQGIGLSHDGRRIALVLGKTAEEIWALENFLPAASTKR
jgi:Tol biopolymer transport system component